MSLPIIESGATGSMKAIAWIGRIHVVGAIDLILAFDQHVTRLLGLCVDLGANGEHIAQYGVVRAEMIYTTIEGVAVFERNCLVAGGEQGLWNF